MFTSKMLMPDPSAPDSSKLPIADVYFKSFITRFDEIVTYFRPTLFSIEFLLLVFFTIRAHYCQVVFSVNRFIASTFISSFLTSFKCHQVFLSKNPE